MYHILLVAHAIVTTDGAGGSIAAVGGTRHHAHYADGIDTLYGHGYYGGCCHGVLQRLEEGFFLEV